MTLKRSEKPTERRPKGNFAIFHGRTSRFVVCVVPEKTWTTTSPPVCCNDFDEPSHSKFTEFQNVSLVPVQGKTSSSFFVTNVALLRNGSKTKCRHARTIARKRFFPKIVTRIFRVKEMGLSVPLGYALPPFIPLPSSAIAVQVHTAST